MIYLKDTQNNVNKLPVYKGKDGKDGINGKSAYELAVKNGYKGTEKEWLDSLGQKMSSSEIENIVDTYNAKNTISPEELLRLYNNIKLEVNNGDNS